MQTRVTPISPPTTSISTDAPFLYELEASDPLPEIDISVSLGTVVLTCDARIGRALGVVSLLLQLPAALTGLALQRFYVRELMRTFDFWFFLLTVTVPIALLGAQLGDL